MELTSAPVQKTYPVWLRRVVALFGGRQTPRNSFSGQQIHLERPDRGCPRSLPVKHQGLLQGTQKEPLNAK